MTRDMHTDAARHLRRFTCTAGAAHVRVRLPDQIARSGASCQAGRSRDGLLYGRDPAAWESGIELLLGGA